MAACTSRAAASMLRLKSNCIVIDVEPRKLVLVISLTPAMRPNCRSSGVATADAIVSGLAPGSDADTEIVGKSTCGSGETGRKRYATAPAKPTAIVSSVVATGRWMKGEERLIFASSLSPVPRGASCSLSPVLRGEGWGEGHLRGVKREA